MTNFEIAKLALGWQWPMRPLGNIIVWAPTPEEAREIVNRMYARHAKN